MSRKKRSKAKKLRRLTAAWLRALEPTHAVTTLETWQNYCDAHFLPFFEDAGGFTPESCAAYVQERLTHVLAATVKKERTALRSFLEWGLTAQEIEAPSFAPRRPADPNQLEQWAP